MTDDITVSYVVAYIIPTWNVAAYQKEVKGRCSIITWTLRKPIVSLPLPANQLTSKCPAA